MKYLLFISFLLSTSYLVAQDDDVDLDLMDSSDAQLLQDDVKSPVDSGDLDFSSLEEGDDLESLKSDIGEIIFDEKDKLKEDEMPSGPKSESVDVQKIVNQEGGEQGDEGTAPVIFDVGNEEKQLLGLSKYVENKIPDKEWNEIAAASLSQKYVVQEGDYLWKISKTLFGSGFYYSKIWSLNPHITNPHEVEPGMVLVFETGDIDTLPNVKLGKFDEAGYVDGQKISRKSDKQFFDFSEFGEFTEPPWLDARKKLIDQGIFFQYASDETYEDLAQLGAKSLNREYQKYEPPITEIIVDVPDDQYDESGIDKTSKITFDIKEGFFLNSFITTNVVQDFGKIKAIAHEAIFIQKFDRVYVEFDDSVKVKPGDLFSVYTADGKKSHPISDRSGYRYTIVAQIKTIKKINNVWEALVTDLAGLCQRGDRITVYTPKINRITRTFSKKNIEAAIINSYRPTANGISYGDVVYLDRGRADGVEMGTVFEVYNFYDKGTGRKITPDPTYKIGELTVITLTDDFSTALVTNSSQELGLGNIALSKTEEQAARAASLRNKSILKSVQEMEGQALDELDVELMMDDISQDLLDKADSVQLTEDELEELERQEREKSIIKDHEKDLKELDRLEDEIIDAENKLNEAKLDEDKFLEQQDLNNVENQAKVKQDPNSFGNLNEIEDEIGRQYMDEDLNARENPYGLTEFDLEEIDELLNTDSDSSK